jgi:hypothetical protein
VPGRSRVVALLPWALCWISLALLVVGAVLRIAFYETFRDGSGYVLAGLAGYALVPLVGALIATRQPANPYGWLWCALGLAYGVLALGEGLRRTGTVPSWLVAALIGASFLTSLCLLVFVLLLFPTGRLPGRLWRWPARATVVVASACLLVFPFALTAVDSVRPAPWAVGGRVGDVLGEILRAGLTVMFLLVLLSATSVVLRFRRAGPVERQQLKWFLLAAGFAFVTIAIDTFGIPISDPLWAILDGAGVAVLPGAVGIAVLRYRLYEIDRIISRTVTYGLLTTGLIGLYLLVVALLRPLLEPLTGSSALAVAGSTLAVAAVFNPARRRLQAVVDRRFDRARYDAARAVNAFAARLRSEVDLDQVTAGLRDTVVTTVAPTHVAVWLRVPSRMGGG